MQRLSENPIGYFNYELVIDSFVEHFNMSYEQKQMVLTNGALARRERAQSRANQVSAANPPKATRGSTLAVMLHFDA